MREVELHRGGQRLTVALDPGTTTQRLDPGPLAEARGPLTLRITATDDATTVDRRYGETTLLPVGIAELSGPGLDAQGLPTRLDGGCRSDLLEVDGTPVALRVRGDRAAALAGEPLDVVRCGAGSGDPLALARGEHLVTSAPGSTTGLDVDRVVLTNEAARARLAEAPPETPSVEVSGGRTDQTVTVGPCPDGCWLDQGIGWNPGWEARVDGESLGAPVPISGGTNGWFLPPSDTTTTVTLRWGPQRWTWAGLGLSLVAIVACVVLAVADRRRSPGGPAARDAVPSLAWPAVRDAGRHHVVWAVASAATAVLVAPSWAVLALALSLPPVLWRRSRLVGVIGLVGLAGVVGAVVVRQAHFQNLAGFGWVTTVAAAHRPALTMVLLIVASTLPGPGRSPASLPGSAPEPGGHPG
ncbi:MAG: hypothetical protein H6518_13310 [Microthrixaceae bacterium]|nr:hypothetical protein [Microthrixaceae bacterium]